MRNVHDTVSGAKGKKKNKTAEGPPCVVCACFYKHSFSL